MRPGTREDAPTAEAAPGAGNRPVLEGESCPWRGPCWLAVSPVVPGGMHYVAGEYQLGSYMQGHLPADL